MASRYGDNMSTNQKRRVRRTLQQRLSLAEDDAAEAAVGGGSSRGPDAAHREGFEAKEEAKEEKRGAPYGAPSRAPHLREGTTWITIPAQRAPRSSPGCRGQAS